MMVHPPSTPVTSQLGRISQNEFWYLLGTPLPSRRHRHRGPFPFLCSPSTFTLQQLLDLILPSLRSEAFDLGAGHLYKNYVDT